jgi:hypothetical protein
MPGFCRAKLLCSGNGLIHRGQPGGAEIKTTLHSAAICDTIRS